MATEIFTTIHTAGLGNAVVIARFFDATQGAGVNLYTFDFDIGSWATTLANATTPNSDTTEKTDAGDTSVSAYSTAAINLANFNNIATPMKILVQFVDTTGTDTVLNEREIVVVKGEKVEQANLTHILGTLLTEGATGRLAASAITYGDVATPALTAASVDQSANNNTILAHADYGNAQLVRSTTPANTLTVDGNHEVTVPDTQKVDIETIKTQAVTCGAGVTVGVYVGSTAAASIHTAADVYTAFGTGGNLTTCATATGFATPTNITAGTITTVTNLTNAATSGDLTSTMKSSVTAAVPTAAGIVNEWETQSQSDPTGFHVNVLEVGGTSQTANDNGADINSILSTVDHGTHGNAKLVRSTTPANALDVSGTGEAGLDFNNIKAATGATTLTNITVPTVTTNTDMRGTDGANTTVPDAATTAAGLHTTTDALIGGLNDLSQANIRTAVGLASANLDTQLADLPTVAEFGARTLVAASYFVVGDYTTPPTVGEIDTELTSTHGADAWTSATGTGDASDAKQTLILEDLADIKGTSFTKDEDSLVDLGHTGDDGDTLETLSDQIDTWGTGITVSRTTTGTAPTVNVAVGQYEAFGVAITASDAQTGDSHELTAYKASDKKTAVFRYTTANGDISVGGSGDTVITISADNTNMKTARQLQYVLWNTTDSEKISEGVIDIEAHPEPL